MIRQNNDEAIKTLEDLEKRQRQQIERINQIVSGYDAEFWGHVTERLEDRIKRVQYERSGLVGDLGTSLDLGKDEEISLKIKATYIVERTIKEVISLPNEYETYLAPMKKELEETTRRLRERRERNKK